MANVTAGDVGALIIVSSGGFSLAGATCVLLVSLDPGELPMRLGPTAIDTTSNTATYTTTGTEFPGLGGTFPLMLLASYADGNVRRGAQTALVVNPALDLE